MSLDIHPIIQIQEAFEKKENQLIEQAHKQIDRMNRIASDKKTIHALATEFNIGVNNADTDGLNRIDFTNSEFRDDLDRYYEAGYFKNREIRSDEQKYIFQDKKEIDYFLAEIEEIKSNLQDETPLPQGQLPPLLNLMQLMNEVRKKITENDAALKEKINSNIR